MTTKATRNKKSRPDQEGSIFYSESRGRWVAQFTAGYDPKTGRRIYRCKMAATRKEAARKLEELKRSFASGGGIKAEKMTAEDWLMEWFHTYCEPKVRPNTQIAYLYILRIIIRNVGSLPLRRLTAYDLQAILFKDLRDKYRTAEKTRMMMKKAFGKAVKLKLIPENPAEDLDLPPRPQKRSFVKPSREDWQKLLSARTYYRGWHLIILTEYVTGARLSELMALKWEDFSILTMSGREERWQTLDGGAVTGTVRGGAVHIHQALITGRAKDGGPHKTSIYLAPTKSREGDRHLPLPADYCQELLAYRRDEKAHRLSTGSVFKDQGYVFTQWDGSPIRPTAIANYYIRLRRSLGISTTFHMLRHDLASRMKASHIFDLKDIQTQLGHSTIRVTMDLYTHINDNEKDQVKNWLQEGIGKLLTSTQAPTIPPKTHTL